MRAWAFLLRVVALTLLIVTIPTGIDYLVKGFEIGRWFDLVSWQIMVGNLALALLCFAGASGLVHLRKLEQKNSQQRAALRYLVNAWKALEDEPEELTAQPTHYVGAPPDLWLSVRRNLAGNPVYGSGGLYEPGDEVRHAPAPTQEIVAPQPLEQRPTPESPRQQPSVAPMPGGVPERYITERQAVAMTARDAQLRRLQATQKKRKSRR